MRVESKSRTALFRGGDAARNSARHLPMVDPQLQTIEPRHSAPRLRYSRYIDNTGELVTVLSYKPE